MTPPLPEFLAGLERERQRRELEQKRERLRFLTIVRNPAEEYRSYRYQIFHDSPDKRKGVRQ